MSHGATRSNFASPYLRASRPIRKPWAKAMHTPVEMVSMKDVARAGRLLAEFAARLDDMFMQKLSFD